ncbi:type II methionyl aminopeptidase [Candidatus Pacearchaeota archaeon CG10_big_fil_rev_8_21_14_0_10_31_9]|nr:MAG: type II methionyl aminopeptidase [Candidatus Pacearchaeota archaeon CG1_02_32_21]PIN91636.1 MAG: type II methionyl aminopeptidase [Candidatus Pacearchaeota archaeon CG10_big_fil_rev_8_21_14_0_10_31_9]PIZ82771.1 MAG: type II methionyl aminopeptidase [Candidatus Pacearchaeota archaeon CG_4_10_14_0_2_um_filter_05_32_18]
MLDKEAVESTRKAGEIVRKVKSEAKDWIKQGILLIEIAEKIEEHIVKLGGKPAFPVNLGINEYAAHYTPNHEDKTIAYGLLKVDFGVHVKGYVADNAFSLNLDKSEKNKKLIEASELALAEAIESIKRGETLGEIGSAIQTTASDTGFSAIQNLSGHSIEQWELHSGLTIPNYNNNSSIVLEEGIYAIEPFITTGEGKVYDGKPSGIYQLKKSGGIRDANAREILKYISEEYNTLPFCSRWLVKKFGRRALISLSFLESAGILHQFTQLVEKSKAPVAQSEATIIILGEDVEVVT